MPEVRPTFRALEFFCFGSKARLSALPPERGCRAIRSLLEFTVKWNIPARLMRRSA
jgi:hypothetical protein